MDSSSTSPQLQEADANAQALSCVTAVWSIKKPSSPIYSLLLSELVLTSATPGTIRASLPMLPVHLNSHGSLHGAVSATLVDWAGGMAIASTGCEKTGVSTDIHVSYLGSAGVGDQLEIFAKCNKVGRTMAYTSVEVTRARDGAVVATGLHTKHLG